MYAMECEATFFDDPEGSKEAAEGGHYLRGNTKKHSMRDITALDIAVTEQDYQVSEPLLHASGFACLAPAKG